MRQRCNNPNNSRYGAYGGRGIKVCARWENSYWDFEADMGQRPSEDHSIDRIDGDGNYEPGNCRWATNTQQQRNRKDNCKVMINGEERLLLEVCEERGLNKHTIYGRIFNAGMTPEEAVELGNNYKGKLYTYKGTSLCIKDWARRYNMGHDALERRLRVQGMTIAEALEKPYQARNATLTREQVIEIKQRLAKGETAPSISRDFNCTTKNIYNIKAGRSWASVTIEE